MSLADKESFWRIRVNDLAALTAFLVTLLVITMNLSGPGISVVIFACLSLGIASSVHSAEIVAQRVGPSLGTLILAVAVTVIEVALILALMSNSADSNSTVARDTVFSALMIVTNGIIGACVLIGGLKFREISFQTTGTSALISVLMVLSILTMVMPNHTTSLEGPAYTPGQLVFVSAISLILYCALIFAQTKSLKKHFEAPATESVHAKEDSNLSKPSSLMAARNFVSLLLSLIAVVGAAKLLSPTIEFAIEVMGAPKSAVGIVVALLVLGPETLAAIRAARVNQLQSSLNLALGSGVASIALTIPAVSFYSILNNQTLALGLESKGVIFLFITFLASSLTFGSGRATALHGLVHLAIMFSFLALSLMP